MVQTSVSDAEIQPAIQELFDQAIPLIQGALKILAKAQLVAEADSEGELRCHEAIEELEGALRTVEFRDPTVGRS